MIEEAKKILKSVFGYDQFISLQQDVIENVLRGRDTLAVMPTGGGKSVCYQIPALLLEGLTVVVSPLISLMKDQVDQLTELEIPAVLLNSSLPSHVYRAHVDKIRQGEAKLLYAAPETLLKPNVLALLESVSVACLAIDEAHCISEWGPDFRPEYRQLTEIRARLDGAVCIALTATATPRVRADILASLGFDDANQFVASFDRENLLIRVAPKRDPFRQVLEFLRKFPNESGIVYCLTRKQVDGLCEALRAEGLPACPYHAGLSETERHENQERFVRDEVRIIVATIAFGMGINKSNVRFVLHHDLPKNIESYYQEIGRAGRDGMRAECLLLFSYGDLHKIKYFINKKEGLERRAANLQLNAMVQLAESDVCRRIPLLGYFGEAFSSGKCRMCDNCLAEEEELTDVTIPAQKFLSCVKRTGESFGTMHIIDVLRGSKAGKVIKNGHDRLSTYGIGKEYTRDQWLQLARQFLHKGLMVQDPDFGGLKLTAGAWDVFKGGEKVLGRLDVPKEPEILSSSPLSSPFVTAAAAGRAAEGKSLEGKAFQLNVELFEAMRRKRKELAVAANVPPYVVFSDKTLAEMATYFPQTPESMLEIHGVGRAKLEKYGSVFLSIIEDYCRDHPVERALRTVEKTPRPQAASTMSVGAQLYQKKRHTLIGESFNAGKSVESLMRELCVKQITVLDHLFTYAREGHDLRPGGLLSLIATIPDSDLSRAMEAFERLGDQFLRPVFDTLEGKLGYEDLKLIRLYRMSCPNRRATDVPDLRNIPDLQDIPDIPENRGIPRTPDMWYPRASGGTSFREGKRGYFRKLVCLANSRKYSGFCVAGKEWLFGQVPEWLSGPVGGWIRPVGAQENGELYPSDMAMQNGKVPGLLDIITVPLAGCCPHAYQSENHRIAGPRWVWNGTLPPSQVDELCDEVELLWINGYHSHNGHNDRMPVELVDRTLSSSLLFIRPHDLWIRVEEGARGLKKVRAEFACRGEAYCLTVTDPIAEARYLQKDLGSYPVEGVKPYVTLSISEPFEGFCYKLAAAILLLPAESSEPWRS